MAALGAIYFISKRISKKEISSDYERGAAWLFSLFASLFFQIFIYDYLGLFEFIRSLNSSFIEVWQFLSGVAMLWVSFRFARWVAPSTE